MIISLYDVVVSGWGIKGMDNRTSSEQARTAGRLVASLEADLSALIERRDPYSVGIVHELQKAIDRIRGISWGDERPLQCPLSAGKDGLSS